MWSLIEEGNRKLPSIRTIQPDRRRHAVARAALMVGFGFLWVLTADVAWGLVVTAGPAGDYATIQEAIDDALSSPSGEEVRVQAGVIYAENLVISVTDGRSFVVSGGWDATFANRNNDPTLTVVDGGSSDRVADVVVESGSTFFLQYLTFQNGSVSGWGGGVRLQATSAGDVGVYHNIFKNNDSISTMGDSSDNWARGGGLYLEQTDTWTEVVGNRFLDNSARVLLSTANQNVAGGGVHATLQDNAYLQFENNLVDGCTCWGYQGTGSQKGYGCGVFISAQFSTFDMKENAIVNSRVHGFAHVLGVAGALGWLSGGSVLERNRWQGATVADCSSNEASLLGIILPYDEQITQRSSLIADSPGIGLWVLSVGTATGGWQGGNLTIAGHGLEGVRSDNSGSGAHGLHNSLVFANGADIVVADGTLEQGSNLTGTDPGCVNPASGYFQLVPGAMALEAGDNNPPGGLSTLDLGGEPRLQGTWVDVGAYEGTSMIWADGFESGDTTLWSDQIP